MSKACTIGSPEGTGSSGGSNGSNDSGMKNVEPINDGFPSRYYPPDVSKGTKGKAGTTGRGKSRIVQAGDKAAHQKPHSSSDNCNSSLYSPFDDDGLD
jgi:hypothetical protein